MLGMISLSIVVLVSIVVIIIVVVVIMKRRKQEATEENLEKPSSIGSVQSNALSARYEAH